MTHPLVSCVLPTYNRRAFIPRAIKCFLAQDWPERELVVLDDGTDPVQDLMPSDPRIHYFYEHQRRNYGAKLNASIKLAVGEFILHFDDDDWHAPNRITRQITPLIEDPNLLVSGATSLYYYRDGTQNAYQFSCNKKVWLGAIAYRKSTWQKTPFDVDDTPGADGRWLHAIPFDQRFEIADPSMIVATAHAANHSPKRIGGTYWKAVNWSVIERLLTS